MKNIVQNFFLFITASILLFNCTNRGREQTTVAGKAYTKYELVADWPNLPGGYNLGQVTGVDIDSTQNIFLIHRAWRRWKILNEVFPDTPISANTILELDRSSGKLLNSWGAGLFIMPHGLAVDRENNIWITDVGLQQVFKFSHDGKLVMTLGEARIPGNDSLHFNYPTDVAFASDGSIYVSDGYRNSRVVKFSREGKYLFEWGRKGTGEGEFDTPHAIDIDSRGNVYVADRENNRIQKFDAGGKFLKQWKNDVAKQLFSLSVDPKNDNLFAVDYLTVDTLIKGADIILFDSTVKYLQRFGRSGSYEGTVSWYHDITIDAEGNIYVGDILGNRIQKFRPTSN
jgi:peptidylamidoglycolate lyase